MGIRPNPQPRPYADDARPTAAEAVALDKRGGGHNPEFEMIGSTDGGGSWHSTRGELDNRFFDETSGIGVGTDAVS